MSPSCDRSEHFKEWTLAMNPSTPGDVLDGMLGCRSASLLERVAEHPNAGSSLLSILATHPCSEVRIAVADNANTPQQVVFELAQDDDPDVRYSIAENPHMPLVVLDSLAHDENPYVAHRANLTIHRVQYVPRTPLAMPDRPDEESQLLEGRG